MIAQLRQKMDSAPATKGARCFAYEALVGREVVEGTVMAPSRIEAHMRVWELVEGVVCITRVEERR